MNAKEYLNQARLLDQRINTKLERIARLRALTEKATSITDKEPVSHTRNVTSLQDQVIRLIEEENSLNEAINHLVDLKSEVSEVLSLIHDPDCQLVLELRYLCFRSWDEISSVMNYHVRTVYKIHGRALQKLNDVLNSSEFQVIHEKMGTFGHKRALEGTL